MSASSRAAIGRAQRRPGATSIADSACCPARHRRRPWRGSSSVSPQRKPLTASCRRIRSSWSGAASRPIRRCASLAALPRPRWPRCMRASSRRRWMCGCPRPSMTRAITRSTTAFRRCATDLTASARMRSMSASISTAYARRRSRLRCLSRNGAGCGPRDDRMIRVAFLSRPGLMDPMKPLLERELPGVAVASWPEPAARDADIAVCWKPEAGALAAMPKLKLIHAIAAGVDNILSDPTLPDLPLCRIVDPGITSAMTEFVLWGALYFHRDFDRMISNARDGLWCRYDQRAARDRRIGILGLGELGTAAAVRLVELGFAVSAWSRSPRRLAGVQTYS